MKVDEVPQDGEYLEGFKRGAYAVDSNGRYTVVATRGWEVESAATRMALLAADAQIRSAWEDVRAGRKSPLWYHLAARQLTGPLLAHTAGVSRLRVWWHCRPGPFRKLSALWLQRYAAALRVSPESLARLPGQPESWL